MEQKFFFWVRLSDFPFPNHAWCKYKLLLVMSYLKQFYNQANLVFILSKAFDYNIVTEAKNNLTKKEDSSTIPYLKKVNKEFVFSRSKGIRGKLFYSTLIFKRNFFVNVKPKSRIGPHHKDIISVLVGSLLGNGRFERLPNGGVIFRRKSKHKEYMLWLYGFFNKKGYTNNLTVLHKQQDKIYDVYQFNTFSFSSWIWLYKLFYTHKKIKVIPENIADLLTPLALAVWVMDKGSYVNGKVYLDGSLYSFINLNKLINALNTRYGLNCYLYINNSISSIVITTNSLYLLKTIVRPHIIPAMLYKIESIRLKVKFLYFNPSI
uniref:Homing endonuclease LAGLIDADG domain-containing protein n=1 Tax=Orbilia brochopaga TaxID=3140254 RepID=A0A481ZLA1_9PEZI|nr:hypothetical protein [Drechslerella brochopaga]QBL02520.1 hypothetical protein [Drechslerella brochopaga]